MKIQILGGGCANCHSLENNVREAMNNLNITGDIEKVTDMDEIVEMGVMRTPALAINGEIQSFGKVLTSAQAEEYLKKYQA